MMRAPLLRLLLAGLAAGGPAAGGLAGCADGAEVPPLEIGSGGIRALGGNARSPVEAYENAYGQIHKQTSLVVRALTDRSVNLYAARESMATLLKSLETMRAMAAPVERPRFDPYVERYRTWLSDLDRNVWGGSFVTDVERSEIEVKTKFNPGKTEILAEFPGAAPAAPAATAPVAPPSSTPAAKAPPGGVPSDKVEVPPSTTPPPPARPAPPVPGPTETTPPAAAPTGASARIYYKAWDRAHDDLTAAVKSKKDARRNYDDVIESLRGLKAQTPAGEKTKKLDIYLDYYASVHEKTKGFTTLPEGEKVTEKDVADELDVAARVIRSLFNPDK
jgi:hypothetical protein